MNAEQEWATHTQREANGSRPRSFPCPHAKAIWREDIFVFLCMSACACVSAYERTRLGGVRRWRSPAKVRGGKTKFEKVTGNMTTQCELEIPSLSFLVFMQYGWSIIHSFSLLFSHWADVEGNDYDGARWRRQSESEQQKKNIKVSLRLILRSQYSLPPLPHILVNFVNGEKFNEAASA